MTHAELMKKTSRPSYEQLLETEEWKARRDAIVERDEQTCTNCGGEAPAFREPGTDDKGKPVQIPYVENPDAGKATMMPIFGPDGEKIGEEVYSREPPYIIAAKSVTLHVHHRYYALDSHPWQYPDEALTTLCLQCHWDLHEREKVPVFESMDEETELDMTPCHRCNGAGVFPEHKHVQNGICFRCNGAKYEELK